MFQELILKLIMMLIIGIEACSINVSELTIDEYPDIRSGYYDIGTYFVIDCGGEGWRHGCSWVSIMDLWIQKKDFFENITWEPYSSWCASNTLACGADKAFKEPSIIIKLAPGNYWILSGIYKGNCNNVGPPIEQIEKYFTASY